MFETKQALEDKSVPTHIDTKIFDSASYHVRDLYWTHDVLPGSYESASLELDINVFTYNDWGVLDIFVSDDSHFDYGNSYIAPNKPEFVGRLSISSGPPTGSFQTVTFDLKPEQLPWLDDGHIYVGVIGPDNTSPGWPAQFRLSESTLAGVVGRERPMAFDDVFEVIEELPVTVAAPGVLANDTGEALGATLLEGPAHGGVTLDADGGFTYGPDPGFFGLDAFTYRVEDNFGGTDEATVTLEVLRDQDGDRVPDFRDNAIYIYNSGQRDTDGDGYGNVADGDLDNNGIVNAVDLSMFAGRLGTTDADADFDGNGIVNAVDLSRFAGMLGKPPGPSHVDLTDGATIAQLAEETLDTLGISEQADTFWL